MRRFLAIFVLLQVAWGVLSPVAIASTATIAACCRRNGKHHCMSGVPAMPNTSDDSTPAVRSFNKTCPHCVPVTLSEFQGLHAARFVLASPSVSDDVLVSALESGYRIAVREWSTRGPPQFSL